MTATITGIITAAGSSLLTYLLNRRKGKADLENTELQNIASKLKIYQDMTDDFSKQMDVYKQERDEMKVKWDRLETIVCSIANDVCTKVDCNLRVPMDKDKLNSLIKGNDGNDTKKSA